MLIGEVIRAGNDVSVRILKIDGNNVRIGIAAPRELAVYRDEICQRIALEQAAAEKEIDTG